MYTLNTKAKCCTRYTGYTFGKMHFRHALFHSWVTFGVWSVSGSFPAITKSLALQPTTYNSTWEKYSQTNFKFAYLNDNSHSEAFFVGYCMLVFLLKLT